MSNVLQNTGGNTLKVHGGGVFGSAAAPAWAAYTYSPYQLEIIQPQAGLDTKNRFYKTYTGLEYNVKVSVFGGRFDTLAYSLTTKPTGMTINSSTGEITWATPVELGSPHTITAQVTDGTSTDTVTWTLTVTTTGFIFIDSTVGVAGVGTIGDPMKLWTDFYGPTEADATYADYFVYFRAGTHVVNGNALVDVTANQWGTQKPVVFLGYPGEAVTQDYSTAWMFYDADGANTYVDNMTHIGQSWYGWRLNGDNVTFRRNTWSGITTDGSSNNQSYIMATSGTTKSHWSISENNFDGNNASAYASLVAYKLNKSIVESNLITNIGNIGIGWKSFNTYCASRGNWLDGGSGGSPLWFYYGDAATDGNFECSWNYSNGNTSTLQANGKQIVTAGPLHTMRNTFLQSSGYVATQIGGADFIETDNVTVSAEANGYSVFIDNNPSQVVEVGNLVNASATNFVSTTTGLLIGAYVGQNATKGNNGMAGLK